MNIFHRFSLKCLIGNKTRTFVTIVGIILSTAMITAVTTIVTSIQAYGIAYESKRSGDWFLNVKQTDAKQYFSLREDERVKEAFCLSCIGYADLEGCINDYKPYLCIQAMDTGFTEHMPIELTDGRMPENGNEILIPNHVFEDGGVSFELGETVIFDVGYRETEDGELLWQEQKLFVEENANAKEETEIVSLEHLNVREEKTYTVVGFYNRPHFENYYSPGYTVLTMESQEVIPGSYNVYLTLKRPSDAISMMREISGQGAFQIASNNALLRFYGVSARSDFMMVLYGMGGILIVIIVLGSVALIYNAFAISISERTKQFGVLSSIGATGRQMKKTVCFEALILCLAGIPIGILSGIGGIGITLFLCADSFEYLIGSADGVEMKAVASVSGIVIAAAIGIITVLISAYLPMRRAIKSSALDTIRQNRDIKLTRQSLKTPGWVLKCFGLEGMIAWKNFKRNKRQYRATVFSLSLSILLFISAGSFSEYLFGSYTNAVEISPYDLSVGIYGISYQDLADKLEEINALENVEQVSQNVYVYLDIEIEEGTFTKEAEKWAQQIYAWEGRFPAVMRFLPDDIFDELTSYYHLDGKKYRDCTNPQAVALNTMSCYEEGKLIEFSAISEDGKTLKGSCGSMEEESLFSVEIGDVVTNRMTYSQYPEFSDRCMGWSDDQRLSLVYPLSVAQTVLKEQYFGDNIEVSAYFMAENHSEAAKKIKDLLKDSGGNVYDQASDEESYRAVLMMVQLFCYGFITLISLICAANIFHTISTNMGLRRREFAMLKSVGMTQKGFRRMLNFECMLYGLKGFGAGFMISFPVTLFMYYFGNNGSFGGFFLPARYVVIAAFCVFAVVYASMLYGKGRLKRENIIEALTS